jgi:hypothetical protein
VAAGILVAVVLAAGLVALVTGGSSRHLVPGGGNSDSSFDPLAFYSSQAGALQAAAAAGYSHVIYAKSPGGIVASVRRTEHYRAQIDAAAKKGPVDATTLEAIVLLESAGRPDIVAGPNLSAAAGLTQILAETGRNLLGMRIDLSASRRLSAQIAAAARAHDARKVASLSKRRGQVDQRFDPAAALAATERYMAIAQKTFGRSDLTVVSYHMGIGNLETALRRYAGPSSSSTPIAKLVSDQSLSYTKLYFDSTPLRHPAAWGWLYALGDDSESYLWRVQAAVQILALHRSDPARLARQAALQTAAPSAERVLRPPGTPVLADRAAVAAARARGYLLAIPSGAAGTNAGLQTAGSLSLRPEALAAALYIAAGVRQIGRSQQPLQITAATTDAADLRTQARLDHGLADADPLHATGYAFDVARAYATPAQAQAFQFMLDRLLALNVIAWVRHRRIIHVVVGPGSSALAGLLPKA